MAQLPPLPPPATRWIDNSGTPALAYRGYVLALDLIVRSLNTMFAAATAQAELPYERGSRAAQMPVPDLINAADDAAAAAAGVPKGAFYRNGSQVMMRVA